MRSTSLTPLASRRSFVLGGLALAACSRSAPSKSEPAKSEPAKTEPPRREKPSLWHMASFAAGPGAPDGERAMILAPWPGLGGPDPASRPLLVALHGRGEAGRGLDVGAGGWPNDYLLDRMHRRLHEPPLTARDLRDMTSPERLAKLNASLARDPYRGVGVACPYTPDLPDKSADGAKGFARFVIDALLPRLRADTGSNASRAATGIDGVSMGGRLSLLVGLTHPEIFGAVGALQPAIREDEAEQISALAKHAMKKAKVMLRLVTSEDDYFRRAVLAASERMRKDGVPHELLVIPGTHGYEFNRGPGAAEMMLWHERTLRGLPPP